MFTHITIILIGLQLLVLPKGQSSLTAYNTLCSIDFRQGKAAMNAFVVVVSQSPTAPEPWRLCHSGTLSCNHASSSVVVQRFIDRGGPPRRGGEVKGARTSRVSSRPCCAGRVILSARNDAPTAQRPAFGAHSQLSTSKSNVLISSPLLRCRYPVTLLPLPSYPSLYACTLLYPAKWQPLTLLLSILRRHQLTSRPYPMSRLTQTLAKSLTRDMSQFPLSSNWSAKFTKVHWRTAFVSKSRSSDFSLPLSFVQM